MGLKSPEEYKASLRDGRVVYYRGQQVRDVTSHPHLGIAVDHASIDYQVAEDPSYRELATLKGPGEELISRYYHIPRNADDLIKRSRLIETTTRLGGTLVILIKEIGTDALFALHLIAKETDEKFGTQYYKRVTDFFEHCRANDFAVAVAQTDVKGDRSLGPSGQDHPDYYVHIVGETSEGIIVRGAKVHTSVSVNSNEIVVLPTRALTEADSSYAVAFAVAPNTPGLKLIASPYAEGVIKNEFDYPISSRHKMIETLTVFDDVLVPWNRVFLKGEWQMAGPLAKTFVEFHRFTAISYKLPLVDLLLGAAELIADYNGTERASHIRDKLTWLVSYAETLRALVKMAALECKIVNLDIAVPNTLIVNMAKWHFAKNYHQAMACVQDVAGGLLVTAPGVDDLQSEEIGHYVRKYLGGRKGVDGEKRLRAMNLIKELTTTDFGGYQAVLAVHAEGSIEAEKMATWREHDAAKFKAYAREMAGIQDS
ncbi:MAG TPA: 4-hydroxyphenylacetate 3-hydroxylase N-terminal domain-containing protein [Pyrinomonadaceae bacterium]|nr:4-hydroxyphenylacetate 3-hydroxylase N-terminal domain-containing protein [Pyrinomonadaceae bacterium]